jgi:DNA-binding NtrC family response regulator
MLPRVLLVDDDRALLASMARNLRGRYELVTAESGPEALKLAGAFPPFATIVADMQMPGMNGIELLRAFEKLCVTTTRIMLTGQTDLATAMEAVNHGHVFRFLTKPCAIEALEATIDAGIGQYHLATAEKVLLEETLAGSVQTLVDLLSVLEGVC